MTQGSPWATFCRPPRRAAGMFQLRNSGLGWAGLACPSVMLPKKVKHSTTCRSDPALREKNLLLQSSFLATTDPSPTRQAQGDSVATPCATHF